MLALAFTAWVLICESITAVIPPVVILLRMIKVLRKDALAAAVDKVKTCLKFLKHVGDVHWHAEFYHNFFQLALSANTGASQARLRSADCRQEAENAEYLSTIRRTYLASPRVLQGMDPKLSNLSSLPDWALAAEMYHQSLAPFWGRLNASESLNMMDMND